MTIRNATDHDVGVLAAIESTCFGEPWSQNALAQALADPKYLILVGEIEFHAVAYIAGWNVGAEAELARVAVLPEQRSHGYGEELVRALVAGFWKRGVREIFLEVRVGNRVAERVYERCGFEKIGRRPRYYTDGEDAIVMRLVV